MPTILQGRKKLPRRPWRTSARLGSEEDKTD
jgi:hypothetical protein